MEEEGGEGVAGVVREHCEIEDEGVGCGCDEGGDEVDAVEVGDVGGAFLGGCVARPGSGRSEFCKEPGEGVDEPWAWLPQCDHCLGCPHIRCRVGQKHEYGGKEVADEQGWQKCLCIVEGHLSRLRPIRGAGGIV